MESVQIRTSLGNFRYVLRVPVTDEDAVQAWLNDVARRVGEAIERQYTQSLKTLFPLAGGWAP